MRYIEVAFCRYDKEAKQYIPNTNNTHAYLINEKLALTMKSNKESNIFIIKNEKGHVYINPVVVTDFIPEEKIVDFQLATITAVSLLRPLSTPIDFELSYTILKKESQPTIEENRVEIKGENNMIKKDTGLNLEFGKIENELAMSINGLAFKNADGGYVTYDLKTNSLTDVSSLIINIDMLYSMPAAIKDIKAGDIIKHNKQYVIVSSIEENGDLNCVQPFIGEKIIVLPKKNIFGFNYITKVVNLMEQFMPQNEASEDNPFGNMMQFILMSSLFDKSEDDGMKKMMMMSMLAKGDSSISPMMMFM